jgi:hypothetical protein
MSSFLESSFFRKYCLTWWRKEKVFVLSKLTHYSSMIVSFDLWMFKGVHDIFALVINFLGFD